MSETVIDGKKCHYLSYGQKGHAVVLLHGWGQNALMMDYIGQFLGAHFSVYNPDLPGFGASEKPQTAYSVSDYAEWLRAFCSQFKLEEPILIAHSFGCRIALYYALKYPVRRMVLTGAAGIRDKRTLVYYLKTYSYKVAKRMLLFFHQEKKLAELRQKHGSEDYRRADPLMREILVKAVNDDISPYLKDIKPETLLVFGTNDQVTPLAKGQYFEKMMPDATLVTFAGADHFAYYTERDRFNAVLDAFLKRDYHA